MEPAAVVQELWSRIAQRDWPGLTALLAPDVRVAWPASGEIFAGAADFVAVQSEYPEGWDISVLRIVAEGELVVSEVEVPHAALQQTFRAASFWTVHGGLVVAATEYWVTIDGEEPPDWRRAYAQ
jgi:ketosteroid isomerase-like protein